LAAGDKAQLEVGDKLSVFSDKAYRKNNGRYFEAVGNVIIISKQDTVYGELATLDQDTMMVKLEGNVRLITKDMTLYGSRVDYNITTGEAVVKNARILTSQFNLVADELIRVSASEYLAKNAEFSTCKDCTESWSIYGKNIRLVVGKYIQIKHGLAKIKGVNVLYVPYLVLPILSERKTGLLFPRLSSRLSEGMSFEQPFFWAIDDSKDMTISPTYWATRGYGSDLQYRQRFTDKNWVEFNGRGVNDTIYEPGRSNQEKSGDEFFRYFTEIETHQQWSPNFSMHERYTGTRDLDFVRDYPQFTDTKVLGSDIGFTGFANLRQDIFSLGVESQYSRNQLFSDSIGFDRTYVQTMPRVTLSSTPYSIIQSTVPMFQHVFIGLDSSYTRFAQVDKVETPFLRNANRFSSQPYINWHFLTLGPVNLKSRFTLDQQAYQFDDHREASFGKNAGLFQNEVSFTLDKIFGLAYDENVPLKYLSNKDLQRIQNTKDKKSLTPLQKIQKENRLVGKVPKFEAELAQDTFMQQRSSYRHSQEYKFIHRFISSENEFGNRRFGDQLKTFDGWFDYEDSVRSLEQTFGSSATRTMISPENTVEFQWNNALIKKTPKLLNYLTDEKYLRDNFSYQTMGYFNVSQGYFVDSEDVKDYRQKLTRLGISTGYSAGLWSVTAGENYFHYENENIFNISATRRFESLNVFTNYNYNSFQNSPLSTISLGAQFRPTDVLGLAMVKDMDLNANKNMRTIYSIDIMPNNNCWILNLNYRESLVDSRTSFEIIFNFGDGAFERYRADYFAVRRL